MEAHPCMVQLLDSGSISLEAGASESIGTIYTIFSDAPTDMCDAISDYISARLSREMIFAALHELRR